MNVNAFTLAVLVLYSILFVGIVTVVCIAMGVDPSAAPLVTIFIAMILGVIAE